ncbi:MAG: O-antigen ligase family protein [Planctomycetaceae bacterium]
MAYLLFMLANAALFVRPSELFPSLGNIQLYMAFIVPAMLCNLQGLQNQLRPRTLIQQPINLCMLGMVFAVPVSLIVSNMFVSAALDGAIMLAKIAVYYFMLVSLITTPQRLRQLLLVTAICSTVTVAVSIVDFQAFKSHWEGHPDLVTQLEEDRKGDFEDRVLIHAVELDHIDALGNGVYRFRMRGLGIFNDPNDVAVLIAVVLMICMYFLTDVSLSGVRFLWLIPMVILATGYVMTQSRGGLLSIGAASLVWLTMRYGKKVAITLGVLGAMAAPVVLGRAAAMNISDGSGQERVQIWGDGLASLLTSKFLTGIGKDYFDEVAGHVAHNSYVHAFVELGLIGGTIFFGCFFFPILAFYRIKRYGMASVHRELNRMTPFIAGILAAWCVGMASLSRCYVPSTYMIVGLCAAFINLAGFYQPQPYPIVKLSSHTLRYWSICSVCLLASSIAFVRLFARYGGS